MSKAHDMVSFQLRRGTKTGSWLTVLPSTINGMEMGTKKWFDALFLRYCIDPPYLPPNCDNYNYDFSISHALDFIKGSLIMTFHNELCVGVADLSGKDFTTLHVRDDLLIHPGRAGREVKAQPTGYPPSNPQ